MIALAAWLALGAAEARVYPAPIVISNEDELINLYEDGLIEADEFDTLIELFNNPLDLNSARPGLLYDLPELTFPMAMALARARQADPFERLEDITEVRGFDADVLDQIRPFVVLGPPSGRTGLDAVDGRAKVRVASFFEEPDPIDGDHANRTHTPDQIGYGKLPASHLNVDVTYNKNNGAGAVLIGQEAVRATTYDPASRDFQASYGWVGEVGRVYAFTRRGRFSAIAGHYAAGFGQGLTFDRTGRTNPHGWYRDVSITADERYRRFRVPKRLFGGAANVVIGGEALDVDATFFASSIRYDQYMYDMGMTGGESIDWTEVDTESPRVYVDGQKVGYLTLPNMYRESLAGVNVTLRPSHRAHAGLTTYVSRQDRSIAPGVEDDLQFVIRGGYPTLADTYGAAGVDGSFGVGPVDLFGEVAYSFTGGADGGAVAGSGAIIKALWGGDNAQAEASLRHYGADFDNPHARGVAAPDERDGYRDRDEQGAKVKGSVEPLTWLRLQGEVDLWRNISQDVNNLYTYARAQVWPIEALRLSAYGRATNRDLSRNGRGFEYGGEWAEDEEGEVEYVSTSTERAGARYVAGTQVDSQPIAPLKLSALYQRTYEDAGILYPSAGGGFCEPWFQIGQYTWFKARYQIIAPTAVTARVRYRDEDVHGSLGDHETDVYLQVDQRLAPRAKLATRGQVGWELPDAPAEFKEYCDDGGAPDLEGTCRALVEDDEDPGEKAKPYAVVWVSVEVRF